MPPKIKIEFCTSCGSKEIEVKGPIFYCPDCDVTYKVTEAGTKVIETNPLGKQNARLDQHDKEIAELKGQKPAESAEPAEPGPPAPDPENKDEDEDEEEPDGFVTWEK